MMRNTIVAGVIIALVVLVGGCAAPVSVPIATPTQASSSPSAISSTTPPPTPTTQATYEVSLTTDPAGAHVWLNGNDTGKVTPFTFFAEPGENTVVAKLDGYQDCEWRIKVTNTNMRKFVTLTKTPETSQEPTAPAPTAPAPTAPAPTAPVTSPPVIVTPSQSPSPSSTTAAFVPWTGPNTSSVRYVNEDLSVDPEWRYIRLRSGPDRNNFSEICRIQAKESVDFFGNIIAFGSWWAYVKYQGKEGYVPSNFLNNGNTPMIEWSGSMTSETWFVKENLSLSSDNRYVQMRNGPGTEFLVTLKIPQKDSVRFFGTSFNAKNDEVWAYVQYQGQYGWVYRELLIKD